MGTLRRKIKEKEMHCDAALVSDTLNKHEVRKLKVKNDDKEQELAELK